jgi:hypothetical protein
MTTRDKHHHISIGEAIMKACRTFSSPLKTRARAAFAVIVVALGVAPASAATYFAQTNTNASAGYSQDPHEDIYNGAVLGQALSSSLMEVGSSANGVLARADSFARVSTGVVRAYAVQTAMITSGNPVYSGFGTGSVGIAKAEFNDQFMLNAAGYATGTLAYLTFAIVVDGSVDGRASVNQVVGGYGNGHIDADWHATTTVNYDTFEQYGRVGGVTGSDPVFTGSGPTGTVIVTARVILGQLNPVMLRAEATAFGAGSSDEYRPSSLDLISVANLGHTLSWGGIVSLSTLENTPITDFTATSPSSNFSYLQAAPVPEPQAWAMMSCGLLFASVAIMRRNGRPARPA